MGDLMKVDTGVGACAGAASRRVPRNQDELKVCLKDEVTRRHEFSTVILEYLNQSEGNKDSIRDLVQSLRDADKVIHSLLEHLDTVDKREKGNLNRDSGVGDSTDDTRRHGVRLSEQGLAELLTRSSLSDDLTGIVPRMATEHTDNDSSSSSSSS